MEDIDCMGDIVYRRDEKDNPLVPLIKKKEEPVVEKRVTPLWAGGDGFKETNIVKEQEDTSDEITLSFLLNLLDGTLEVPGRIIIITTNMPDKLDDALIRPGRIDMIVNFQKCNRMIINEMFNSFYDTNFSGNKFDQIEDYKWTPAEVNAIMFRNFRKPENAINELIQENPTSKLQK
jgi:hypothetical protein